MLNLRSLTNSLSILVGVCTCNHIFSDIIFFGEVEERTNFVGTLGSKASRDGIIGKSHDGVITHFDHGKVENSNVRPDNASSDGLAFTFTCSALSVSLVTLVLLCINNLTRVVVKIS